MKDAASAVPHPSAAEALSAILSAQARAFEGHYAALRESDDPENPHKARVALRRMRSALEGFAPMLDDAARRRLSRRNILLIR